MKKSGLIALVAAAAVAVCASFTGCDFFAPCSSITITNDYSTRDPAITSITVTGADGSTAVDGYQPTYSHTSGIFTFNYDNLPGGYGASTEVVVYDAQKYTVTVKYSGSSSVAAGSTSCEIEVTEVGTPVSLSFNEGSDGNPCLTVKE